MGGIIKSDGSSRAIATAPPRGSSSHSTLATYRTADDHRRAIVSEPALSEAEREARQRADPSGVRSLKQEHLDLLRAYKQILTRLSQEPLLRRFFSRPF